LKFVWLMNPETRRAWVKTRDGITEVRDGVLEPAVGDCSAI
jgi:hypothetical protein